MKVTIECNPKLANKVFKEERKSSLSKNYANICSTKNSKNILTNFSHKNSASGAKLSYIGGYKSSTDENGKSPKEKLLKSKAANPNLIEKKRIDLFDPSISKDKKNHNLSSKSYFTNNNVNKKVKDASNVDLKLSTFSKENTISSQNSESNQKNLVSNFSTYSKLSKRNNALFSKHSNNLTGLSNQSQDKINDFFKIHEKLTKRISDIKASESSLDVINSMSETYLNTLGEIALQIDPEIGCIINVIYSGLRTTIESYSKKISNLPEILNKLSNFEREKNELKENYQKSENKIQEMCVILSTKEAEIAQLRNEIEKLNSIKQDDNSSQYFKKGKKNKKKDKEICELKKELHLHKKRENKLIYFYNLLEEKGFPVKEIYESQIRSISTERFTSNDESDLSSKDDDAPKKEGKNKDDKFDFTRILNLSNLSIQSINKEKEPEKPTDNKS